MIARPLAIALLLAGPALGQAPEGAAVGRDVVVAGSDVSAEPYLGVRTSALPDAVRAQIPDLVPSGAGLLVTQVVPKSPAERAGVEPFDVIVRADRVELAQPDDLDRALAKNAIGAKLSLQIVRGGRAETLSVVVEGRPAEETAKSRDGTDLTRAALPYSQTQAPRSVPHREGIPHAAGPIGERSILVTSRDGRSFAVTVDANEERWTWTAEGDESKPPAELPERHAANVARLLAGARRERERGALHFRVQPRADGDQRSVVLLIQQPGAGDEYRLFEIERTLGEGDALPVDRLLEIASLKAEFERLGPAVREKLEAALRRFRVPPVQARVRRPQ